MFIYSERANEIKENFPIIKRKIFQLKNEIPIGKKENICELRNNKRRRQEQEDNHNCIRPLERPRSHQKGDFAKKL